MSEKRNFWLSKLYRREKMPRIERVTDREWELAQVMNNVLKWFMSAMLAGAILGVLYIWLFYEP